LLVLDNFESLGDGDRRRVIEFLKRLPQGTKAIVTSRECIDLQADRVCLGRIAWEDAAALLDKLARNSPLLAKTLEVDRRALYMNTGGNPLILQWVAGQLGRGRCQKVDDALSLLNESPEGDKALEFIFGDLLNAFTPDEVRLLAALTHFSQPVELVGILKISGVPAIRAQAGLEALAGRAIVTKDSNFKGFALMPLVAGFLSRIRPRHVRITGDRLADSTYALVTDNRSPKEENLNRLENAWVLIQAALPILVRGQNDRLQAVCDGLDEFLIQTARWDELLALCVNAEKKAVDAAGFKFAGWRAYRIGWIYNLRGRGAEVLIAADRAAKHWGEVPTEARNQALTNYLRGIGFRLQKEYPAALEAFRQALELYRDIADDGGIIGALNEIGEVQRLVKNFANAKGQFEEALQVARNIDSDQGAAACLGNLAKLALDQGLSEEAERLALEALPRSIKLGRQDLIAEDCYCYVRALDQQNHLKEAETLAHCRWAVEILRRLRLPDLPDAEALLHKCEAAANEDSSPGTA
jgi:tetratricopeptide (TPR) repeat protein